MINMLKKKLLSALVIEIKLIMSINQEIRKDILVFFDNTTFYKELLECMNEINFTSKDFNKLISKIDTQQFNTLFKALAIHFAKGACDEMVLVETKNALEVFKNWLNSHQIKIDTRNYREDDRIVRRMNALARLIKPRNSESACTAVTLVSETLYVSMNNTGPKFDFKSIVEVSMTRLNILLNYPVVKNPNLTYEEFIGKFAPDIIKESFHLEMPLEVLTQDLAKLVDSLHLKPDEFPELCALLSESLQIIFLYPKNNQEYVVFNAKTLESQNILIDNAPKQINKKDIHAEQILVNYLFEYNKLPSDQIVRLGVSKLCCGTCIEFLTHYPQVQVQGTHGKKYENTYNMKTKEPTSGDELLNPRYVCPHQSPHTTPIKSTPTKGINKWSENEKENMPLPILSANNNGFFKEVALKPSRKLNFVDVQDNNVLNQ